MGQVIGFGKYSGHNTDVLAKSPDGRNYLAWGVENLKSPKWRKEFKRALSENDSLDVNAIIAIWKVNDPEFAGLSEDYEHAEELVREQAAQREYDDKKAKMENYLRRKLSEAGVSDKGIRFILSRIWEFDELVEIGTVKFDSPVKKKAVMDLVERFLSACEKLAKDLDILYI